VKNIAVDVANILGRKYGYSMTSTHHDY